MTLRIDLPGIFSLSRRASPKLMRKMRATLSPTNLTETIAALGMNASERMGG